LKNNIINDEKENYNNNKINEDAINENRKTKKRIVSIKADDIDNEFGIRELKNSQNNNNKHQMVKVETKGKICTFCIIF
jgi:hypothetical protein